MGTVRRDAFDKMLSLPGHLSRRRGGWGVSAGKNYSDYANPPLQSIHIYIRIDIQYAYILRAGPVGGGTLWTYNSRSKNHFFFSHPAFNIREAMRGLINEIYFIKKNSAVGILGFSDIARLWKEWLEFAFFTSVIPTELKNHRYCVPRQKSLTTFFNVARFQLPNGPR